MRPSQAFAVHCAPVYFAPPSTSVIAAHQPTMLWWTGRGGRVRSLKHARHAAKLKLGSREALWAWLLSVASTTARHAYCCPKLKGPNMLPHIALSWHL